MKEDPALFKHELAIVLIAKNEAPYIREWIDYHLLAGVDHFYIYDNDSEDDLEGLLRSYVEIGLVDYAKLPGKCAQLLAYNDAVARFKFDCRYLAFIDADEFIRPLYQNQTIKDVLHEVLDAQTGAEALAINWHIFGAGGNEKADLETGVLERFVFRVPNEFEHGATITNSLVKTIANPRCIDVLVNPHFALLFPNTFAVDEAGRKVEAVLNRNVPDEKIIIHHYMTKSKEEYTAKVKRGNADLPVNNYRLENFNEIESASTVKDESILDYRRARYERLSTGDEAEIRIDSPRKIDKRRLDAVARTLLPTEFRDAPDELFGGRLHEFLTCRAIVHELGKGTIEKSTANFFEELALKCIHRSLTSTVSDACQVLLMMRELPNLLALEYEAVDKIKSVCRRLLPQIMMQYRLGNDWINHSRCDYLLKILTKVLG